MTHHFLVRYNQSGSNEQREALRGDHIAYRKSLGSDLVMAGPILSDQGQPKGSVVIIAAVSEPAAREIASRDPYVATGLLTIETLEAIRIAAMTPPAA